MPAIISGTIIATPNPKKHKIALKRSFDRATADFTYGQPFKRQRSPKVKNGIFERNSFSMITSVFEMIE